MDVAFTIISFLIGLAVIVYAIRSPKLKGMIPFSSSAMDERRGRIEEALAAAQRSEARLAQVRSEIDEEIAKARAQAEEIVARAHREAVAVAEEAEQRSRDEVQALLDRARGDVQVERERAVSELRRELSTLVVDGAGAVLRDALDARAQSRLIDESLQALARGARDGA